MKISIPHRQATDHEHLASSKFWSFISIPHRQATDEIHHHCDSLGRIISIPHRQATDLIVFLIIHILIISLFQSLIGRLQTSWIINNPSEQPLFQSLIGRLKTVTWSDWLRFKYQISIPHRQATDGSCPNEVASLCFISIPHRQATDTAYRLKELDGYFYFNPSQVGYRRTASGKDIWNIPDFNPSQVGYRRAYRISFELRSSVFQSLIGRLQTGLAWLDKFIEKNDFNPSQVGYRRTYWELLYRHILNFNPSQVGYRHKAARKYFPLDFNFNPSQVGYRLVGEKQTKFMRSIFQSLIGRLQTPIPAVAGNVLFSFQSLIGRLQTGILVTSILIFLQISIPHRQATDHSLC